MPPNTRLRIAAFRRELKGEVHGSALAGAERAVRAFWSARQRMERHHGRFLSTQEVSDTKPYLRADSDFRIATKRVHEIMKRHRENPLGRKLKSVLSGP